MTSLDKDVLAERIAAVERHLQRVAQKLPAHASLLSVGSDASDSVILHLWQAVQIVIDLGTALCVQRNLGVPTTYRDAFERLRAAGIIDDGLALRLAGAAGFRNVVAHAYETIDMARVYEAASNGPADLREFLRIVRDLRS
ncbi:MAG TPA: HepT-like ribonuclease domain-containing protein [Candidatus Binatia bacterium]|nr:HepT-like ribonuclease domain-containing protein [Candidatus Binatia bacterium]